MAGNYRASLQQQDTHSNKVITVQSQLYCGNH